MIDKEQRKAIQAFCKDKGYRKVQANVGDIVIWNSRTGPTPAEFRGWTTGMDGYEATIIVRPNDSPPYQITVDSDQIKSKGIKASKYTINDATDYVRSVARRFQGRGRYSKDAIIAELRKYATPSDETYYDVARRFLSDDDIVRTWQEATGENR